MLALSGRSDRKARAKYWRGRKKNEGRRSPPSELLEQTRDSGLWDLKDVLNSRQNRFRNRRVRENAVIPELSKEVSLSGLWAPAEIEFWHENRSVLWRKKVLEYSRWIMGSRKKTKTSLLFITSTGSSQALSSSAGQFPMFCLWVGVIICHLRKLLPNSAMIWYNEAENMKMPKVCQFGEQQGKRSG